MINSTLNLQDLITKKKLVSLRSHVNVVFNVIELLPENTNGIMQIQQIILTLLNFMECPKCKYKMKNCRGAHIGIDNLTRLIAKCE